MLRRLAATSAVAAALVAFSAPPASAGCVTDYLRHSSPGGDPIGLVNNEIDAIQALVVCVV